MEETRNRNIKLLRLNINFFFFVWALIQLGLVIWYGTNFKNRNGGQAFLEFLNSFLFGITCTFIVLVNLKLKYIKPRVIKQRIKKVKPIKVKKAEKVESNKEETLLELPKVQPTPQVQAAPQEPQLNQTQQVPQASFVPQPPRETPPVNSFTNPTVSETTSMDTPPTTSDVNPTFSTPEVSENSVKRDSVDEERINFLYQFLTQLTSLEDDVKKLKELRDHNQDNAIVELRNRMSEKIDSQKQALAPITRAGNRSNYVVACCNIIEDYHKKVGYLLDTIDDKTIIMHVNRLRLSDHYFDKFDERYSEIENVRIEYPAPFED